MPKRAPSWLQWFWDAPQSARGSLLAAWLGWLLDSFDVMLYALVVGAVIRDFSLSTATAGLLGSLTLIASGIGGILFGMIADRYGRRPALSGSLLMYSVFTFACGLSTTVWQLGLFRFLLGLGMGGEWTSGAALVSETWPDRDRAKAMGLMQSAWSVGYAAAALVVFVILPRLGWRAVFFIGILPAFVAVWIQRGIPAYLSFPESQGGIGRSPFWATLLVVLIQVGTFLGYVSFGFVADAFGRRRSFVVYILTAAVLILGVGATHNFWALALLGPVATFFGTGFFSGFGTVVAELYPTAIRATAQGLTYNVGRMLSALAPFVVGLSLAQTRGFGAAFELLAFALLAGAATWIWLPESRGWDLVASASRSAAHL